MVNWDALQYFHFLRPWWLLGVVPFMLLLLLQLQRRDVMAQWRPLIADHLLHNMIVERDDNHWFSPVGASGLLTVLLFVALAGPSWEKRASPFSEDKAALVIALDLSESMNQGDIQPNRLQRSKQKIVDLLSMRGDAHTALIAYAGTAHTVIPLSNDRQVISHFLDAMSTNMMPRPGKSPESILPVVQRLLKEVTVPVTVLLVGDGATENSISKFENYFEQTPHQLLVWGVGMTQQQLDDQATEGYLSSTIAVQDVMLEQLASVASGYYQSMTTDKSDVARNYQRIESYLLRAENDDRPWVDAGYYLIFPIMAIFLLWFRKGWTLQW